MADMLTTFPTGSVRSAVVAGQGIGPYRPRYDLISPVGLRRLAETYGEGAQRYGDRNWERGQPVPEILNRVVAHLYTYLSGDRSEDHLAHAAWGLFAAMHMEEHMPDMLAGLPLHEHQQ